MARKLKVQYDWSFVSCLWLILKFTVNIQFLRAQRKLQSLGHHEDDTGRAIHWEYSAPAAAN
jgi:hypothetical protein